MIDFDEEKFQKKCLILVDATWFLTSLKYRDEFSVIREYKQGDSSKKIYGIEWKWLKKGEEYFLYSSC